MYNSKLYHEVFLRPLEEKIDGVKLTAAEDMIVPGRYDVKDAANLEAFVLKLLACADDRAVASSSDKYEKDEHSAIDEIKNVSGVCSSRRDPKNCRLRLGVRTV